MAKNGGMKGREQGPSVQILCLEKAKDSWRSSLTLFLPSVVISAPSLPPALGSIRFLLLL